MSANITSLPATASAVAQIVSNGTIDPTAADLVDAKGQGPFDALFRQLLIKQNTTGADANPLLPAATPLKNEVAIAGSDLAALLPFLDALGLTQTDPAVTAVSPPAETVVEADPALTILPSPADSADPALTTLAGSAVSADPALATLADPAGAADPALTILAGPASIPVASHPAISAAATTPGSRAAAPATALPNFAPGIRNIAPDTTNTPARGLSFDASQSRELSAGREFSSQLVAVIAASKEPASSSGSTAAAALQVITNAAPQTAQTTASPSLPVAHPVGTPGWTEEIGNRVVWMANRMEGRAELTLTPPQMGRIEVSLSITGDQATANFFSGNPAVREALEAALPRLREVLADAGIQLGQTQVSAENSRQSAQQEKNSGNFGFSRDTSSDNATLSVDAGTLPASAALKAGRGLVDVFA